MARSILFRQRQADFMDDQIRESIKKEKNQIVLKLFQLLAISYMKHFQKDFEELKSLDCMGHF